jgi:hypothetical protein
MKTKRMRKLQVESLGNYREISQIIIYFVKMFYFNIIVF